MKREAVAELEGKVMSTMNVMTQLMRLHQVTCGHFKADDDTITEIKNNKIDSLLELLEETEGKVIIWANYRADAKNIVAALKKAYTEASTVEYHGSVDPTLRQDNIAQFSAKKQPYTLFRRKCTNWRVWNYPDCC